MDWNHQTLEDRQQYWVSSGIDSSNWQWKFNTSNINLPCKMMMFRPRLIPVRTTEDRGDSLLGDLHSGGLVPTSFLFLGGSRYLGVGWGY